MPVPEFCKRTPDLCCLYLLLPLTQFSLRTVTFGWCCVQGHLWMYGYALLCSSRDLCGVALLSHAMKIAFLLAVEEPYMRQVRTQLHTTCPCTALNCCYSSLQVYKQHVREHTPLTAAIARRGQKIRNNEKAMFLINWYGLAALGKSVGCSAVCAGSNTPLRRAHSLRAPSSWHAQCARQCTWATTVWSWSSGQAQVNNKYIV